jgi:hypothetical protein
VVATSPSGQVEACSRLNWKWSKWSEWTFAQQIFQQVVIYLTTQKVFDQKKRKYHMGGSLDELQSLWHAFDQISEINLATSVLKAQEIYFP